MIKEKNSKMKKAYYYLFYRFYKFGESTDSIFPSDLTATASITIFEMFFLASLFCYYKTFINQYFALSIWSYKVLIPVAGVVLLNYFMFLSNQNWKTYFNDFNKYSKHKQLVGIWIILGIILLDIANLFLSFML